MALPVPRTFGDVRLRPGVFHAPYSRMKWLHNPGFSRPHTHSSSTAITVYQNARDAPTHIDTHNSSKAASNVHVIHQELQQLEVATVPQQGLHQASSSTRRHMALGLAAACLSILVSGQQQQQAAWAKPALLDLPSCNKFQQGGPIQYCELVVGRGESPLAGDLILVDYTARAVATGQVFDGSRNFKFTVGNGEVIPGWELGILGGDGIPAIKEGGSRTLLISPELAFGSAGDGCLFGLPDSCRIPPNSPVEITFKYRGLGY